MGRSYWVVTDIKRENTMQTDAAPRPLAEVLRRTYPFVESATRLETVFGRTISVPDTKNGWIKKFNEARNVCFAEPQYFNHFAVEWISGNPQTALKVPNTIVISERYARKYFDDAQPLGRTLRLDNRVDLTVTGIIKKSAGQHPASLRCIDFVCYNPRSGKQWQHAGLGRPSKHVLCAAAPGNQSRPAGNCIG
ncbi:ABC transporter permease [Dyadobacter sp. CY323]|uniref:ABC transporter permease n=1 Tax=Dyadobacter sp. CY323 TaxID=2907302 RepID=UPI001F44DB02|nr:ABC transporter permease [Dyadobacter sp. CY323]